MVDESTYLANVNEKQNWILTTGPMKNGQGPISRIVDGVKGGSTVFHTPVGGSSGFYPYPWVQVDFNEQRIVKGVYIYGYEPYSAVCMKQRAESIMYWYEFLDLLLEIKNLIINA